jgi:protein-S-isoprenylcysteine O-methyltransferase Ste14
MAILAATTAHHRGLVWGIILIVLGVLHLTFRGFYARRAQAFHDARQDTAPAATRGFYRRHGSNWYARNTIWAGSVFIVLGVLEIAISS